MNINFHDQASSKSDEELLNIFINSDDYQEAFVTAVEQELIRRNVSFEEARHEKEQKEKFTKEKYRAGRKGNEVYIILSIISAFLGGILGIVAGYVYSQSRHSDNTGVKYYVYDQKTRELGKIMMVIGVFALLATLIWKLT